jgi:predicted homoserine dehydrogenase-like protein
MLQMDAKTNAFTPRGSSPSVEVCAVAKRDLAVGEHMESTVELGVPAHV